MLFGLAFWFATRASFKTSDPLADRRISEPSSVARIKPEALDLHNAFAMDVLDATHEDGPAIIPTAALARVLLALTNGSEGKTYEILSKTLGFGDQGESEFNRLQRLILDAENESGDVTEGAAIWFVWPFMPGPGYTWEMSDSLEVDVLKLGSARLGAKKAVASWAERRAPGLPSPHDSFTELDIIMGNGFLTLSGEPVLQATSIDDLFTAEGPSWDLYWVNQRAGWETARRLIEQALRESPAGESPGPAWRPPTSTDDPFEASTVLARLGLGALKEDNDFRGISPELDRRSAVTRIATQVKWTGVETDRTPKEVKGWFVIIEPKTRAIIAVGAD